MEQSPNLPCPSLFPSVLPALLSPKGCLCWEEATWVPVLALQLESPYPH